MTDNKDLNQRFDHLEKRLDSMSLGAPLSAPHSPFLSSDEIDLRELFAIVWQGKWWIIGVTVLFLVSAVIFALSLPNKYKSEGTYALTQRQGDGALGAQLSGQMGGLASLAGFSLGGVQGNDVDQAMAIIDSWPFLEKVVNKHNLKPLIMGVKGWNKETGELIWDNKIYDPINKKWLREPPKGMKAEPSSFEVYTKFSKMLTASFDKKTTMLNVAVEYYSPVLAQQWVTILVSELNETFRLRDVSESNKNVAYLEQKISETGVAAMHSVFYKMIEAQMKTLMLAEVDEQYLVRRVVEPKVAELKSSPNRKIILILAVAAGFLISTSGVFVVNFLKPNRDKFRRWGSH